MKDIRQRMEIKKSAKAVYLTADLTQAILYLDAVTEIGAITEEEADKIMNEISEERANIPCSEIQNWKKFLY